MNCQWLKVRTWVGCFKHGKKSCETQTIWTLFFGLTLLGHRAKLNLTDNSVSKQELMLASLDKVERDDMRKIVPY